MFARATFLLILLVGLSMPNHTNAYPTGKKQLKTKKRRKHKSGGRRLRGVFNEKLFYRLGMTSPQKRFSSNSPFQKKVLMTLDQVTGLGERTASEFVEKIRKHAFVESEQKKDLRFAVGIAVVNLQQHGEIFISPGKLKRQFSASHIYSLDGEFRKSIFLPNDRESLDAILSEVDFRKGDRDKILDYLFYSTESAKTRDIVLKHVFRAGNF